MPDISMCMGEYCNKRESCYRHKAKPNAFGQSFIRKKEEDQGEHCKHYWPLEGFLKGKRKKRRKKDEISKKASGD